MVNSRIFVVFFIALTACLEPSISSNPTDDVGTADVDLGAPDSTDADSADADAAPPVIAEVLDSGKVMVAGLTIDYHLVRVTDPESGHVAYVQWNVPSGELMTPHPVFVYTQPYVGIDWTGEDVDNNWAALGPGFHPDVNGPSYVQGTSSSIEYKETSPKEEVEHGTIPLINDIPTLMIYGRFYAGGSIQDDIDDTVLGLRFLESQPNIDRERIVILGAEWGGFEALYGAAYAPQSLQPAYGIAFFPLSDFSLAWTYGDSFAALSSAARDLYNAYFEPYRRRILASTHPNNSFEGFTHDTLSRKLSTQVLFVHDSHNTAVPFSMAQAAATALDDRAQELWFIHDGSVDLNTTVPGHGNAPQHFPDSIFSMVYASVLTVLLPDTHGSIRIVGKSSQFVEMLSHLKDQQSRGFGISNFPEALAAIADERIEVYDDDVEAWVGGPKFVADGFNQVFGTSHTSATIREALSGLKQ